jgi:hypothetical protein
VIPTTIQATWSNSIHTANTWAIYLDTTTSRNCRKQQYWAQHTYFREYYCKSTKDITKEIALHVNWIVTTKLLQVYIPWWDSMLHMYHFIYPGETVCYTCIILYTLVKWYVTRVSFYIPCIKVKTNNNNSNNNKVQISQYTVMNNKSELLTNLFREWASAWHKP